MLRNLGGYFNSRDSTWPRQKRGHDMRMIWGLAVLIMLMGCQSITSIHPLYLHHEKAFDENLLGEWVEVDTDTNESRLSTEGVRIEKAEVDGGRGYIVQNMVEGSETGYWVLRLAEIKGQCYVDALQKGGDSSGEHVILRLIREPKGYAFQMLDGDVIKPYLKEHPKAVKCEVIDELTSYYQVGQIKCKKGTSILLTSKTRKLRKFIAVLDSVSGAWGDWVRVQHPKKTDSN